jgi:hypothetical protein
MVSGGAAYLTLLGFLLHGGHPRHLLGNMPIDLQTARRTPATLPADWAEVRARWEPLHSVRTFLSLVGIPCVLAR